MKICCLTIVDDIENNRVLMVENQRGINKGYMNFPGGKREFDETIEYSNVRETMEETGIIPLNMRELGKIEYQPVGIEMHIFYTNEYKGRIRDREGETKVKWVDRDHIPFDRMRSSDVEWVKNALTKQDRINKRVTYKENDEYTIEDIFENIEKYKKRYKAFIELRNRRLLNKENC